MSKKTSIQLVQEFHETFEHVIANSPCIPPTETNDFRVEFMREEAKETADACLANDIIQLADGLGDMQYVLDGWFLNSGLHIFKDEIMAEIHRSNMTKLCATEEQAIESKENINARLGANTEDYVDYKPAGNGVGFIIFRVRDNKIGKSIYYEKPNLTKIINGEAEATAL